MFFVFVQFEFTHAVGPHAGRYVVEPALLGEGVTVGDEAQAAAVSAQPQAADAWLDARNQQLAGVSRGVGGSDVLVVGVVDRPAARPRLLRRARQVDPAAPPAEVPISVLTYVRGSEPLAEKPAAGRLGEIRFSEELQQRWVDVGLRVVNLAIRAYRAGAPDPYRIDVTRRDARAVRVGYGDTAEVQNGGWRQAYELPPEIGPRPKRIERLRPAEAVATILSGSGGLLQAEELLLRALIDLDQGRTRGAAHQAAASLRLLPHELAGHPRGAEFDLEAIAQRAVEAEQLAAVAARGELDAAQIRELEALVEAVGAMLDELRYPVAV